MIHRHRATSCAAGIRAKWQQKWRISGFVLKGSAALQLRARACVCIYIYIYIYVYMYRGFTSGCWRRKGSLREVVIWSNGFRFLCRFLPSIRHPAALSLVNTSMISLSFLYAYPVHDSLCPPIYGIFPSFLRFFLNGGKGPRCLCISPTINTEKDLILYLYHITLRYATFCRNIFYMRKLEIGILSNRTSEIISRRACYAMTSVPRDTRAGK